MILFFLNFNLFSGEEYGESVIRKQPATPNMTGDYANHFNNNDNKFNFNHHHMTVSSPHGDTAGRITTMVAVGTSELIISGTSEALVNSAKEVLEEFFSLCSKVRGWTGYTSDAGSIIDSIQKRKKIWNQSAICCASF